MELVQYGGRRFLPENKFVSAQSMGGNVTSSALDVRYLDNVGIQANFTGTPTGTFSVLGSIDNTNFIALTLSSTPAASGADGQVLIDLNQLSVPYVKLSYTRTGGTGSLDAWVFGKSI